MTDSGCIEGGGYCFERVSKLKYLGTILKEDKKFLEQIKERITGATGR